MYEIPELQVETDGPRWQMVGVIKAPRVTEVWRDADHPPHPHLGSFLHHIPSQGCASILSSSRSSFAPFCHFLPHSGFRNCLRCLLYILPRHYYNVQFHTNCANSREVLRNLVPPHWTTVGNHQHCAKANWRCGRGNDQWDDCWPGGWELMGNAFYCLFLHGKLWAPFYKASWKVLWQGCHTHFHRGPHQPHGCLQRAECHFRTV